MLVLSFVAGCAAPVLGAKAACDALFEEMTSSSDVAELASALREVARLSDTETTEILKTAAHSLASGQPDADSRLNAVVDYCLDSGSEPWNSMGGERGPSTPEGFDPSDVPAGAADGPTAQAGEPFTFSGSSSWRVTLSDVQCRLMEIRGVGAGTSAPALSAKPNDGNEFCVLTWDLVNIGAAPAAIGVPKGTLFLGRDEVSASLEDEAVADRVLKDRFDVDSQTLVNPGNSTKRVNVYQITQNDGPTHVSFADEKAAVLVTVG